MLKESRLYVLHASPQLTLAQIAWLQATFLPAAEIGRLEQHKNPTQYTLSLQAHAFKRKILSAILGKHPPTIAISHTREGKPMLQEQDLYFNLSHTNGLVALLVSGHEKTGVDAETISADEAKLAASDLIFTKEEKETAHCLTPAERVAFFYKTWVLKEAYLKALGTGFITEDPATITVTWLRDNVYNVCGSETIWMKVFQVQHTLIACTITDEENLPFIHYQLTAESFMPTTE